MEQANTINALDDAAGHLARQIALCGECAGKALDAAWGPLTPQSAKWDYFAQFERFMRLSVEVAGALAKLNGDSSNTHRQLISVERIERTVAPPPAKAAPPEPVVQPALPESVAKADEAADRVPGDDCVDAERPKDFDDGLTPEERAEQRENYAIQLAQCRVEMAARERGESEATIKRLLAEAKPESQDYAVLDRAKAQRTMGPGGRGVGGVDQTIRCG